MALSARTKQTRWLSEQISQHFQEKRCIGLIFTPSKALILHWLAVLDSGREPIILLSSNAEDKLVSALIEYLLLNKSRLKLKDAGSAKHFPVYKDDSHFCSVCMNPLIIEKIVKYFNSFIIHGLPNSVPYLESRIRAEGKKFRYVYSIQDLEDDRGKELTLEINVFYRLMVGETGYSITSYLPYVFWRTFYDEYAGKFTNLPGGLSFLRI